MDAAIINSQKLLTAQLIDKPKRWAEIIASRGALRALPYMLTVPDELLKNFLMAALRANLFSWAGVFLRGDLEENNYFPAATIAGIEARKLSNKYANTKESRAAQLATFAAARSANAASNYHTNKALAAAEAVFATVRAARASGAATEVSSIWACTNDEYGLLEDQVKDETVFFAPLWPNEPPQLWATNLGVGFSRLLAIDPNYSVWIDWYERRVRGERAAFDIPGDNGRVEDKRILRRLVEATDEDFWGKGREYVNATLKGWLDESRARVAPLPGGELEPENRPFIEVPHPVFGATAFGVNSEGKLDPLPHYDQQQLRDLPNQRRAFIDVRAAALELQEEGQRLGPKLTLRIDRFVTAFPEQFEDAEAWPIWSAAAALRTLYWKHKAVADSPDPDDAKLEPAVAVELRGLLDIYNVFAFGDDGLRQKDENSISPQERLKAEELAKLSKPVEQAIIDTIAIRTEITLAEIKENLNNVLLAVGTPYADQTFDQANKTTQNLAVGLFDGARVILADPRAIGTELAKLGIKVAATTAATAAGYTAYNYAALIEFIAVNAEPLKAYAITVFQSYPHLHEIVDRIRLLWIRLTNKN